MKKTFSLLVICVFVITSAMAQFNTILPSKKEPIAIKPIQHINAIVEDEIQAITLQQGEGKTVIHFRDPDFEELMENMDFDEPESQPEAENMPPEGYVAGFNVGTLYEAIKYIASGGVTGYIPDTATDFVNTFIEKAIEQADCNNELATGLRKMFGHGLSYKELVENIKSSVMELGDVAAQQRKR